jgi:murein DD-endopeptidase MepM/ murein hydrolase activator NlpD
MRLDYSPADPVTLPAARRSFLVAALVLVSVGALMSREGTANRPDDVPPALEADPVVDADLAGLAAPTEPLATPAASPWVTVKVKSGQTLSKIFDDMDLPQMDWVQLIRLGGDANRLKMLRAGDVLHVRKGPEGLHELTYALDESRTLQVSRTDAGFEAITLAAEIERRPTYAVGTVTSSLYESGLAAGLPQGLIIEMADIFGYDIDFAQDIRVGDKFTVIYEDLYKNGEKLRAGNILAAEFVNQGHAMRAVRYVDPQGNAGFYAPEGQSLRKAFIRTPLDVFRISSRFSTARRHPILNRIRAHKGTDYAAPTGTPVKATGDGRVAFVGNKGGYGKVLVIRHGGSYQTVYGHLSRFRSGLSYGSRVQQGQVIGYVGTSGLATGPHLHYEFHVNGVQRDPQRVILPRASALPRQNLDHFHASSSPLLAQLDALNRSQVAQAN